MSDDSLSSESVMAALLAKDSTRSRDEPEVAANIGAQLAHMELTSWPISIRRRIRDVVGRLQPQRICEVGAGIGHLSAWLFDLWSDGDAPKVFEMVEPGGKFGVILQRQIQRYSARDWAAVKVGRFEQLVAEQIAWLAANSSIADSAKDIGGGNPILSAPFDCIIVDVEIDSLVECLEAALTVTESGGIILTVEPEVPTEDLSQADAEGRRQITGFQKWIDFIHKIKDQCELAFQPLYGGTLVVIHRK
jgi:predicted O-methyltransferase YrrM